jgi:hypothetical protein
LKKAGKNHIQAVEVLQSLYPAVALGLNYPEFSDCCLRALLMVAIDVDDMLQERLAYARVHDFL